MFGRRVFGGTADTFHLTLDYGPASSSYQAAGQQVRLSVVTARLEFEWSSDEDAPAVLQRFIQKRDALLQARERAQMAAATGHAMRCQLRRPLLADCDSACGLETI